MKLVTAGKPAVALAAEAFSRLVKVSLEAHRAPEALAIVLKGNPEFLDEERLADLADKALDEAVRRLASGTGSCDTLIGE